MLKIFAWLGVFVGTPSLASYATLSFQDHFMVFFMLMVGAWVLAFLPLLHSPDRR